MRIIGSKKHFVWAIVFALLAIAGFVLLGSHRECSHADCSLCAARRIFVSAAAVFTAGLAGLVCRRFGRTYKNPSVLPMTPVSSCSRMNR